MVQCIIEESGEHIIAGAGELHLEICLKVSSLIVMKRTHVECFSLIHEMVCRIWKKTTRASQSRNLTPLYRTVKQ